MKTKSINLLMVDDHPMILKGYEDVLKDIEYRTKSYHFQTEQAYSILEALETLEISYGERELDLVLLDIGLPDNNSDKYPTGLELGLAIRKSHPQTKIIIITSYNTHSLLQKLIDVLKPEGLLLKGELKPQGLKAAILEVLDDVPHFSKTVRKFLTQRMAKPYVLDHYDMLILYYLSEGVLTKDLERYVPCSLSSIERRKKRLKEVFGVTGANDIELLLKAKEDGFL